MSVKTTVVIPTYNRCDSLKRLLHCLELQKGGHLARVVVCDDGSSDGTFDEVRSWKGRLPVIYCQQDDLGFRAGQARNLGIERAIGDIVIFVDDDVVLAPDFILAHIQAHVNTSNPCLAIGFRRRTNRPVEGVPTRKEINAAEPDNRCVVLGTDGRGLTTHPTPWMFGYTCNLSMTLSEDLERFDEVFTGWGMEDIDFAYRLYIRGYHPVIALNACVLHVDDGPPRDPFRCEQRKIKPVYETYLRNSVYLLGKFPEDQALAQAIRTDLQWYTYNKHGWVKDGEAHDVETVIQAFRAEQSVPLRSIAEPACSKSTMAPPMIWPLQELAVELTEYCNLKCTMCSTWQIREHGVPTELLRTLLRDAFALGARKFIPCGGEVFLRKDFVNLVAFAHDLGYTSQEIVTNGTLITDEALERLQACPSARLHVSIEGPEEIHDSFRGRGSWQKSMSAVRRALARRIRVGLSSVIMRSSLPWLWSIIDFAAELEIPEVSFQPFQMEIFGMERDPTPFSFGPYHRDELIRSLSDLRARAREKGVGIYTEALLDEVPAYLIDGIRPIPAQGCVVPSKLMLVSRQGEIYPCFFMRDTAMGNVYVDQLQDVWHSQLHKKITQMALDSRCPGCLAACSDVQSYNERASGTGSRTRFSNGG